MSSRQHKSSVYGVIRHGRKKPRRPLPLPKRPIPDKRQCVSRRDEDYVNLGHWHQLTHLRYPSGSGRPPPKPKRVGAIQEKGSSPISLNLPPPKPAPRPTPKLRPKVAPRPISPNHQQQLGVVPATPTGRPSRPLLPPKKKLQKVRSIGDSNLDREGQKRVPPKPSLKLQASPNSSSPERHYPMDKEHGVKFNGYTSDINQSSASAQPLHASKPPKPLAPPPIKPRKPHLSPVKKQDNLNLKFDTSLQQKPPTSLPSPKQQSSYSLFPDKETNGKPPAFLKGPVPKPRLRKTSRGDDIDPSLPHSSQAEPEKKTEENVLSPTRPTARRRLGSKGALPIPHGTEDVARYSEDDCLKSTPIGTPPKPPTDSTGGKYTLVQIQASPLKAPPTAHRRTNNGHVVSPAPSSHYQPLRTRKKGGGIRIPLWRAPPPPAWTPPQTPTSSLKKNSNKKDNRSSAQLRSSLHVSPPSSPTSMSSSTSFILPPFQSYGQSYPSSDELERSWVVECEPVVKIARNSCSSPTPKSPLTVEFEEDLFNCRRAPGYQQQLPINVVQELQNNLRKQIMNRSGI